MIIMVSGGFDPLHSGHISMFRQANLFGEVWAIVNTDEWLQRKKGFVMLPYKERSEIVRSTQFIQKVISEENVDIGVDFLKDTNPTVNLKGVREISNVYKVITDKIKDAKDNSVTYLISKGTYEVNKDVIFPHGARLILEPGTNILLSESKSIFVRGSPVKHF